MWDETNAEQSYKGGVEGPNTSEGYHRTSYMKHEPPLRALRAPAT